MIGWLTYRRGYGEENSDRGGSCCLCFLCRLDENLFPSVLVLFILFDHLFLFDLPFYLFPLLGDLIAFFWPIFVACIDKSSFRLLAIKRLTVMAVLFSYLLIYFSVSR